MNTLTAQPAHDNFMNLFSTLLLVFCLIFQTVVTAIDWHYLAIIIGSSFSGAVLLAYFRREKSRTELAFKVLGASLSGVVCGGAAVKWFAIVEINYIIFCYFVSSLVSLVIIGAALSQTERNAPHLIIQIFQRVFNFQPKERKRMRRHIEKLPETSVAESQKENDNH